MDEKKKLCIKDVVKDKIDRFKSWAKRNEDELLNASLVVCTGIGCATMGFVVGRINGYFSGIDDGFEIGTRVGKSDATAEFAEEILLSAMEMDENSTENVK